MKRVGPKTKPCGSPLLIELDSTFETSNLSPGHRFTCWRRTWAVKFGPHFYFFFFFTCRGLWEISCDSRPLIFMSEVVPKHPETNSLSNTKKHTDACHPSRRPGSNGFWWTRGFPHNVCVQSREGGSGFPPQISQPPPPWCCILIHGHPSPSHRKCGGDRRKELIQLSLIVCDILNAALLPTGVNTFYVNIAVAHAVFKVYYECLYVSTCTLSDFILSETCTLCERSAGMRPSSPQPHVFTPLAFFL